MDNKTVEKKEIVKKTSTSSIVKWVIILLCLIVLVGGVFFVVDRFGSKKIEVSSVLVQKKLESSSELITSKLTLQGYINHSNKGIAFLNEDSFFMTYIGTVKAGIDIKKIDVNVDKDKETVIVSLPKSEILDVDIDDNSIKYLNENFAFFKTDSKKQADLARTEAKKDMKKQAAKTGLLDLADKQSKTLVKGLLKDTVGNYKIKFKTKPSTSENTTTSTTTSSKK